MKQDLAGPGPPPGVTGTYTAISELCFLVMDSRGELFTSVGDELSHSCVTPEPRRVGIVLEDNSGIIASAYSKGNIEGYMGSALGPREGQSQLLLS